jgi:hypothetical protein
MSEHWSPGVARAMHELANATPAAPPVEAVRDRQLAASRRPAPWLTAAVLVMVIGAVAGLVAIVGANERTSEGGGSVRVFHTRVETSTTFRLDCPNQINNTGQFTTTIIDTWADRAGKRWRSRITYPDGSTHDMIYVGSALYPTSSFERGTNHGARVGCIGPNAENGWLVSGPDLPYYLNVASELAPDEHPYVTPFTENASPIKDPVTDARGRSSKLWELRVTGTVGFGKGDGAQFPSTQLQQWWVDPSNDQRITQRRYSNTVDTLGTASLTETLISDETADVPNSVFSTDGYTPLPFSPRPSPPTPPPSALATAPSAGDPATWRLDPSFAVTPADTTLHVKVTRLGCSSGHTGTVNPPELSTGTNNVRITFTVEHSSGGDCPSNDEVPYTVQLPVAIGRRPLIDGTCLQGAAAAATSLCTDDHGVRWTP